VVALGGGQLEVKRGESTQEDYFGGSGSLVTLGPEKKKKETGSYQRGKKDVG